ncbi:CHAT domain-containing protein [Nemania serpens]|nr:CHAT domain-containing protein [Nemania serpens]
MHELQSAIFRAEEALNFTPCDHASRAGRLSNLGNSLGRRYERTGALEELQSAIFQCANSVDLTPAHHACRASRLSSLGNWIAKKYERTGDFNDLEKAICCAAETLAITPPHHSDRPSYLNSYGIMLARKYLHNHDLQDMFRAIVCIQEALHKTPPGSPGRIYLLSNLSTIVAWKFQYTGFPDDLNYAIRRAHDTLVAVPIEHPYHAFALIIHGDLLYSRSEQPHATNEQKRADFDGCLLDYQQAWQSHSSPLNLRIKAAHKAAKVLLALGRYEEANGFLHDAVQLLPNLSPHNLTQQDRQYFLRELTGIATLATSAALETRKGPVIALQLLEQGRTIGTGQLLGMRTALISLKTQQPEIAKRLEYLHDVLRSPTLFSCKGSSIAESDAVSQWPKTSQRYHAATRVNIVINEIRQLPGFETFLLPPTTTELKAAASGGPVVVINVSTFRCDAVLVTTDSIRLMPLSLLNYQDLERMTGRFKEIRIRSTSRNRSLQNREKMLEILEWLWDKVASPILNALGFGEPPMNDDAWPRLWWIPTGPLSMLPLHAAGRHNSALSETVIDRVISSYSPSVKALLYAQRQNVECDHILGEACLAAMTTTPGCSPLPTAAEEVELVKKQLRALGVETSHSLYNPRKADLIYRLKTCNIFHFAGHGALNPMDPSKSCLLLDDWERNPLTVESIIDLNLNGNGPLLAYLSACSTGASPSEYLYDESINIMTACQLAGFRHVVGSMWELTDRYPLAASSKFYQTLGEREAIDDYIIAWAVHTTARHIREVAKWLQDTACEGVDPFAWAGYIHIGP